MPQNRRSNAHDQHPISLPTLYQSSHDVRRKTDITGHIVHHGGCSGVSSPLAPPETSLCASLRGWERAPLPGDPRTLRSAHARSEGFLEGPGVSSPHSLSDVLERSLTSSQRPHGESIMESPPRRSQSHTAIPRTRVCTKITRHDLDHDQCLDQDQDLCPIVQTSLL